MKFNYKNVTIQYMYENCIYVWKNNKAYKGKRLLNEIANLIGGKVNEVYVIVDFNKSYEEIKNYLTFKNNLL